MPLPASGTRFLDWEQCSFFKTAHTKQAGAVVSRLWLGHFAGRDELGDVNDYEQIILQRETKHEGVD
jgi:hypothetical protein